METSEHVKPISAWAIHGVALCQDAQADGVPCTELGRDCETCAEAVRHFTAADLAAVRERIRCRDGA